MAIVTQPRYVEQVNPFVPRYGLFQCVNGPYDMPQNAISGGLQYELSVGTLPTGLTLNCINSGARQTMSFPGTIATQTAYPFSVYASISCSSVGLANWGLDRVKQYLYQQLISGEQATVENIFSLSANDQTLGLSNNPNVVTLPPATYGVTQAIAVLESWLYAQYGLPGIIHVPQRAAAYVARYKQARQHAPGDVYRTASSTVVSFGNYAGLNATGGTPASSPAHTTFYITGQMAMWRTPDKALFMPPVGTGRVLNRSTNLITTVMEREYILTYDSYIAAIDVTLDGV